MRWREFVFLLIKSINPLNYKMLSTRKKRDGIWFIFYLALVASLLHTSVFLVRTQDYIGDIEYKLNQFEQAEISGMKVSLKEPVVLLNRPKVVIDLSSNTTNDAYLLITRDTIYKKTTDISLWPPGITTYEETPLKQFADLRMLFSFIRKFLLIILLILIPSIILMLFLWYILRMLVAIFIGAGILWLVQVIRKKKAHPAKLLRFANYSVTILVIVALIGVYTKMFLFPCLWYIFHLGLIEWLSGKNIKLE